MTHWEYHFIQVTNAPFLHSGTVPDFVNELGRDGWELVGFDVHNQAWFKRPLQDIGEEGSVPGPGLTSCPRRRSLKPIRRPPSDLA